MHSVLLIGTESVLVCDLPCRWHPVPCDKGVTFVTINMVSSCNNLCKEFPDRTEYSERNKANLK